MVCSVCLTFSLSLSLPLAATASSSVSSAAGCCVSRQPAFLSLPLVFDHCLSRTLTLCCSLSLFLSLAVFLPISPISLPTFLPSFLQSVSQTPANRSFYPRCWVHDYYLFISPSLALSSSTDSFIRSLLFHSSSFRFS